MNTDKAKSIFLQAVEDFPPGEWAAFLEVASEGDPKVQHRVEWLLAGHQRDVDLLDQGKAAWNQVATIDQPITEQPGAQIGVYKLLEQIGEGGMGVVYMAEQEEPLRRKVALKIIKPGMDSKQVVARFEAERQALALMDHPNIAKVHDAGSTESGRPYFIMELVKGVPITQYCDRHKLDTRQRLELFVTVCGAIQHAHQKGIIHRDLKPNNVMVELHDVTAVPKVIDFGVAKATNQRLTEQTLFTNYAQMIGTPLYMSPEQAQLSGLDVDTRSDVYSLGVLLYEILTGTTPFDQQTMREAGYDEMRRMIREDEPPKPSDRISTLKAEALSTVSEKHGSDARKLCQLVRGDLDWIVMKALEKDRTRRYETASSLAEDVQRYLKDEPVSACPPSATYRMGKFARRNRAAMVLTGAVAAALVIGLLGTAWQAVRATRAEQTAQAEAERANREAATAEQKAAEAAAVVDFLVNDLLGSATPEKALGRKITVEGVLANAEKKIDTAFVDQPLVEAAIRHTLGCTYLGLGDYSLAKRHFERACELRSEHLGPENVDTLRSMNNVVNVSQTQRKLDEVEKTLQILRGVFGSEHPGLLRSMNCLAVTLHGQRKYVEAQKLLEETLQSMRRVLGPEHRETLVSMSNLATVLHDRGKLDEAQKLLELALPTQRRVQGPEHPETLWSMFKLATVFRDQRKLDEAQKLLEETLTIQRRVLSSKHPQTLRVMVVLAGVFHDQGRLADSEKLHEEALQIRRRVLGPQHQRTIFSMGEVAGVLMKRGKLDEAQKLLAEKRKLDKAEKVQAENQGKLDEAEKPHEFASKNAAWAVNNHAWDLVTDPQDRDPGRAAELAMKAVELAPMEGINWNTLGVAHYRAGDWNAAIEALDKSEELLPGQFFSFNGFFLATAHWQLGHADEARDWYDRAVDWMEEEMPEDEELRAFRAEAEELLGITNEEQEHEVAEKD